MGKFQIVFFSMEVREHLGNLNNESHYMNRAECISQLVSSVFITLSCAEKAH